MADEVIEYKSPKYTVSHTTGHLGTVINRGIKSTWIGRTVGSNNDMVYTWKFDSEATGETSPCGLRGYILAKRSNFLERDAEKIDIDFIELGGVVEKTILNFNGNHGPGVQFEYYLTYIYSGDEKIEDLPYELMFSESDKTDAILVVDEKKLHVNKAFLSYHSDFFRALFTSNFKEEQMDEIPIGDVSYDDFGSLLSIVHPQCSFPNDNNAEKLLELADRFMMPFVIRQVEHHLLNISKIESEKMMWMADKYSMTALLKTSIQLMDSVEKAKKARGSPEYKDLSDKTKAALFERVVQFI